MIALQRLLSYLLPIKIYQIASDINQNLEVTWNNGRLVLDSKNTNFSYGSLERVMQIGLQTIGKETILNYQTVLLLGVGGGSSIKLLQDVFLFSGEIIGVELDPKVITIANEYFHINKRKKVQIVEGDAAVFVSDTELKYDLIVVDIFQDSHMPSFLFTEEFTQNLKRILSENGSILFNSIVTLSTEFKRNQQYQQLLQKTFTKVRKLSNVEGNNELFIYSK